MVASPDGLLIASAMDYRIVPIAQAHIDGFRSVLDRVARERRYLAFLEAPPPEGVREFILNLIRANHIQLVALAGEEVVGWCDALPGSRPVHRYTATLGMGIVAGHRRRGLGLRLIRATLDAAWRHPYARVELHVRENNAAAIALYEKVGFEREGRLRRDVFVDGVWENSLIMAILRPATFAPIRPA